MTKHKRWLFILFTTVCLISAYIFYTSNKVDEQSAYSGSNGNGSISFSIDHGLYKFEFIPSEAIAKEHIKSDGYMFDFYTSNPEEKVSTSMNVFTETIEDKIFTQFNNNIITSTFERVEITTKKGVYVIPLNRTENK